eukprot:1188325-Prorocentrum_minimum.AAC.2
MEHRLEQFEHRPVLANGSHQEQVLRLAQRRPEPLRQRLRLRGLQVVPLPPGVGVAAQVHEYGAEGAVVVAERHQVQPRLVGQPVDRVRVLRHAQRGAALGTADTGDCNSGGK